MTPTPSNSPRHVYEKDTILKQIATTGQCPLTGHALAEDDLLDIKTAKSAAPQIGSTMPQILQSAANEYDRMQKEIFTLKAALVDCRKQLSTSLYQNEAACYTVKRLIQEKEKMKEQMTRSDDLVSQMRQAEADKDNQIQNFRARQQEEAQLAAQNAQIAAQAQQAAEEQARQL